MLLREAQALEVHATPAVHETLRHGTAVLATLERYCRVDWHPVTPGMDKAQLDIANLLAPAYLTGKNIPGAVAAAAKQADEDLSTAG